MSFVNHAKHIRIAKNCRCFHRRISYANYSSEKTWSRKNFFSEHHYSIVFSIAYIDHLKRTRIDTPQMLITFHTGLQTTGDEKEDIPNSLGAVD